MLPLSLGSTFGDVTFLFVVVILHVIVLLLRITFFKPIHLLELINTFKWEVL